MICKSKEQVDSVAGLDYLALSLRSNPTAGYDLVYPVVDSLWSRHGDEGLRQLHQVVALAIDGKGGRAGCSDYRSLAYEPEFDSAVAFKF